MIENRSHSLTLLDGDHEVVVTQEEYHQAAIAARAPGPDGRARRVAVELVPIPAGARTRPGSVGIEVRLDGRRVGELTDLMARRYGPLVQAHLLAGQRPAALARVHSNHRGLQIELRLPRPESLAARMAAVDVLRPGPARPADPEPAAVTEPIRTTRGSPASGAPRPTAVLPTWPDEPGWTDRPPHVHRAVAGVPPSGDGPGGRPAGGSTGWPGPGGGARRPRRTPWLVAAGVVALLVVVGVVAAGHGTGPTTASGRSSAEPTVAATATVAPAATAASPAPLQVTESRSTDAATISTSSAGRASAVPAPRPASRVAPVPAPPRDRASTVAPAQDPPAQDPPAPAPPVTVAPASACDPNYSGCVPIASDVDCAGGSGNGPAYVQGPIRVIGKDIYGLDSDHDGIACE